MSNANLSWISDEGINSLLDNLIVNIRNIHGNALVKVSKNVEDPFLLMCIAAAYGIRDVEKLKEQGTYHSVSTAISSALGRFHQDVLGKVQRFVNHDAGYDLENTERKILAEIKNKHNTMNASNRERVVDNLKTALKSRPGYRGYLVITIPRKNIRYEANLGNRLFETDGASFYALATGERDALKQLYRVLEKRLCANAPDIADYCRQAFERGIPE
ncbi:MAG: Eco47II family restriction endonuclease [Cellvibrionales bacterium]|nr:Eco47II family restriction endonuclease [Cellvibrionales bacterium]